MRDYLQSLGAAGDIAEVAREVDPRFELAAVTRAAQRAGDRAVLFRKVRGSRLPVVTNVYGSRRRLLGMIGAKDGRFAPRFAELCENLAPVPSLTVETQRVEGSLLDLPQIVYHERDGGP